MPIAVCGALCSCSFGMAPASLIVPPKFPVLVAGLPIATIMDFAPIVNISTFGMCNTLSNPTVAAATAAALGVLTPMPCVPSIIAPWIPTKPTCLLGGIPVVSGGDKCMCMWGGSISINMPGQFVVL